MSKNAKPLVGAVRAAGAITPPVNAYHENEIPQEPLRQQEIELRALIIQRESGLERLVLAVERRQDHDPGCAFEQDMACNCGASEVQAALRKVKGDG